MPRETNLRVFIVIAPYFFIQLICTTFSFMSVSAECS